jgi:hypothetical protein
MSEDRGKRNFQFSMKQMTTAKKLAPWNFKPANLVIQDKL